MALRVSKEGRRVRSADMIQRQKEKGEEEAGRRGEGATERDGTRLEEMRREDTASGREGEGANLRSPDATHPVNQYPSPRRPLARSPARPLAASVLLFGFF